MSMEDLVGTTFTRRGQTYHVFGVDDCVTKKGRRTVVLRIWSKCADCDDNFVVRRSRGIIKRGHLNRRCKKHHAPGKPVGLRKSAKRLIGASV